MSQDVRQVDTDLARMRIMSARAIALERWPYVSSLLFGLRLVAVTDGSLDTMAVDDGWRLYYDPEFVLSQAPEALATVLLHECLHVMHVHGSRFRSLGRADGDHPIWNLAADAAINEVLDNEGMPWTDLAPVRAPDLDRYGVRPGMTAEEAFFAIVGYRDANADEPGPSRDCGSASGGAQRDYELPADDAQAPSMPADRKDGVRERVAHDIAEHARKAGRVPGELLRWADELLNPVIDWRTALASRVRRHLATVTGRRDFTYLRPSRRQESVRRAGIDAILPAMRQPAPPRVVCILDTSGSVPDDELRDFASEISGIVRAAGVVGGVGIICCDARAYPLQRVRNPAQAAELRIEGGGGTDLRAGLVAAAEQRPVPQVVVILTDGHTPWPADRPRKVDAVIVVLSDPAMARQVPAWCTVIVKE
jgi:predicted metal-dependent peptidase